jgi:hypothetical protein
MEVPSSYKLTSANKCPACNKEFDSLGARQRHLVTDHFQYGDLSGVGKSALAKYKREIQPISHK